MDISQLEIALLEKEKASIRSVVNPLLVEIGAAIPEFVNKETYKQRITAVIDSMFNDVEFNATILNDQTQALFNAVCELPTETLIELGLDHLCL